MPLLNTLSRLPVVITVMVAMLTAPLSAPLQAQGRIDVLNSRGQIAPLAGATVVRETLSQVSFRRGGPDAIGPIRKGTGPVQLDDGFGDVPHDLGHHQGDQGEFPVVVPGAPTGVVGVSVPDAAHPLIIRRHTELPVG